MGCLICYSACMLNKHKHIQANTPYTSDSGSLSARPLPSLQEKKVKDTNDSHPTRALPCIDFKLCTTDTCRKRDIVLFTKDTYCGTCGTQLTLLQLAVLDLVRHV